jgi:hypothetical protein
LTFLSTVLCTSLQNLPITIYVLNFQQYLIINLEDMNIFIKFKMFLYSMITNRTHQSNSWINNKKCSLSTKSKPLRLGLNEEYKKIEHLSKYDTHILNSEQNKRFVKFKIGRFIFSYYFLKRQINSNSLTQY